MENTITVREHHGVTILDAQGSLTLGRGTRMIRDAIESLMWEGQQRRVVLNLEKVTYVDSATVGELIAALRDVEAAGGQLKLANVGSRVLDILVVAKLHLVFEVYEDEVAAVRSFMKRGVVQIRREWLPPSEAYVG